MFIFEVAPLIRDSLFNSAVVIGNINLFSTCPVIISDERLLKRLPSLQENRIKV